MKETILYINDDIQEDDYNFIESVRNSEYNFKSCIITGYVQKWDGKHNICPVETEGLLDAIYRCTDKMDGIIIKFVEDHLELECSHHDGTNVFQIYLLSEAGYDAYEDDCDVDFSNEKYHDKMLLEKILV